jgi:SOS response regulatory protein OraA/RecX
MYDPADQPTIEQLLTDFDVHEYLEPSAFARLLQELESRDRVLQDDAVKQALAKRGISC